MMEWRGCAIPSHDESISRMGQHAALAARTETLFGKLTWIPVARTLTQCYCDAHIISDRSITQYMPTPTECSVVFPSYLPLLHFLFPVDCKTGGSGMEKMNEFDPTTQFEWKNGNTHIGKNQSLAHINLHNCRQVSIFPGVRLCLEEGLHLACFSLATTMSCTDDHLSRLTEPTLLQRRTPRKIETCLQLHMQIAGIDPTFAGLGLTP